MATNYVQDGCVLDYTPSGAAVASGDVVIMGVIGGVALTDIADGATGAVQVKGVFTLTKKSTDVIAQGALIYWDTDPGEITTTSTDNTLIGVAAAAAGNGATTVNALLNVGL